MIKKILAYLSYIILAFILTTYVFENINDNLGVIMMLLYFISLIYILFRIIRFLFYKISGKTNEDIKEIQLKKKIDKQKRKEEERIRSEERKRFKLEEEKRLELEKEKLEKAKELEKNTIYKKYWYRDDISIFSYKRKNLDSYIVIDTETTGLSAKENEIIEISAIKIVNNEIIDKFSTLVHPTKNIPATITKINGITNDMVLNAPKIYEIMPEFIDFIGDEVLVGHNIKFDIKFINSYLPNPLENRLADTMLIARRKIHDIKNYKLITLIKYFKLGNSQEHRSLSDCMYTHQVYQKLKELE